MIARAVKIKRKIKIMKTIMKILITRFKMLKCIAYITVILICGFFCWLWWALYSIYIQLACYITIHGGWISTTVQWIKIVLHVLGVMISLWFNLGLDGLFAEHIHDGYLSPPHIDLNSTILCMEGNNLGQDTQQGAVVGANQTNPQPNNPQQANPQQVNPQGNNPQQAEPQANNPQQANPQGNNPEGNRPQPIDPQVNDPQPVNPYNYNNPHQHINRPVAGQDVQQPAVGAYRGNYYYPYRFANDEEAILRDQALMAGGLNPNHSYQPYAWNLADTLDLIASRVPGSRLGRGSGMDPNDVAFARMVYRTRVPGARMRNVNRINTIALRNAIRELR